MDRIRKRQVWGAVLALTCGMSLCASETGAAEEPIEVASLEGITVEAKRPDWEGKLSPGTVNIIRPEEFKGEQKTLPDLLLSVPGVHVREVNGKGQYTTMTIRGSTAAQVGIFVDGVLMNLGGDTAVDLSTIPIANVERVEVYRGYIPSRFGGTFMGGVVNIVTKKPQGTRGYVELGKSSYGGKKAAAEVNVPVGSGTLMFGTNYESSHGDFEYDNYAAERFIPYIDGQIANTQAAIASFNTEWIDTLTRQTKDGAYIDLTPEQIEYYKNNQSEWVSYVQKAGEGGLANDIYTKWESQGENVADQLVWNNDYSVLEKYVPDNIKQSYIAEGYEKWQEGFYEDWTGTGFPCGHVTDDIKEQIKKAYAENEYQSVIQEKVNFAKKADPATSEDMASKNETLEEQKKQKQEAEDARRRRRYNDYEKTSTILKWQDKHWVVKGSYETLDRHMPDSVWLGDANAAVYNNAVDLRDLFYYDSRRQKQNTASLMVQRRQEVGKLEWGWMLDYMHQNKEYRAEHINPDYPNSEWDMQNQPLREWSRYKSNKYTAQIDGTYKVNDRHMLDFLINFSRERLDIEGSNMAKILSGETSRNKLSSQIRNRYEQELFNIQIQDSITLDEKGSLILTPGLRYNQSKITGYSDGSRFEDGMFTWINPKDSQTNGKFTWQLALKKVFNDSFTMRVTGGTYYRLLNMAEIAGDGAGILPAPIDRNGENSMFPVPEDGKQFDISFLFHRKWLGAQNTTTLTYFWRDSDNMLQLERAGKDYWSYFNDNKGRANGIEFQTGFKWKKLDLDLQMTYTNAWAARKNSATGHTTYEEIWPTYQPKWEGNVRLTYRPNEKWSIFAEGHYTDEYFTYYRKADTALLSSYMAGKPVASLTVMNLGLKFMPTKDWQLTLGCNDVFNAGPRSKIQCDIFDIIPGYINSEFPIQGRTYYLNVRYTF